MLIKTIKYELRASGRLLLPFFGLAVVLSAGFRLLLVVAPLIWQPAGVIITTLAQGLGGLLLLCLIGVTFIALLLRFWQSMVAGEATLTFSLPVPAGVHIWGRFLVATLYTLASCAVAVLCGFLILPGLGAMVRQLPLYMGTSGNSPQFALSQLPANLIGAFAGLLALLVVLGITTNLFKFYAAFALGTQFGKDRILGSIVAYVVLNAAQAILLLPALLIPLFKIGFSNQAFEAYLNSFMARDTLTSMQNMMGLIWSFALYIGGWALVFMAAHIFITHHCFGKRLNLE